MASFNDITITTSAWTDLVDENSSLSAIALTVQNRSGNKNILLFEGGASAPTDAAFGISLAPGQAVNVNNANIWVRGEGGFRVGLIETV